MLVSFTVSNFRSFAARQVFSLLASPRLGSAHENHTVPLPSSDQRVLRAAVIYGANGAGKSNLFAALRYVRHVALAPHNESRTTTCVPFGLSDLRYQPSTFDIQFIAADKLYRYGFSVDDERIIEERLAHVAEGEERLIYTRHANGAGKVAVDAPGLRNENETLRALVAVGSRHNQTFLATVRATLEGDDVGKTLTEVIEWLDKGLALIGPESTFDLAVARLAVDGRFRQFASEFLKASATGVTDLRVDKKELSQEEVRALLPKTILRPGVQCGRERTASVLRVSNGTGLLVERTAEGQHFYDFAVQASHKPARYEESTLALSEESDGTKRLLDLIPALYQAQSERAVYVIDEIGRSLHPMLVYKYLEYFLRTCTRSPSQIIVTTHEPLLLDLDLLRRDEIWFAEKDASAATHLYALTEFNMRKDLQVRKGYLAGRFGAVPFLGAIDRLFEKGSEGESRGRGWP